MCYTKQNVLSALSSEGSIMSLRSADYAHCALIVIDFQPDSSNVDLCRREIIQNCRDVCLI